MLAEDISEMKEHHDKMVIAPCAALQRGIVVRRCNGMRGVASQAAEGERTVGSANELVCAEFVQQVGVAQSPACRRPCTRGV